MRPTIAVMTMKISMVRKILIVMMMVMLLMVRMMMVMLLMVRMDSPAGQR